MGDFDSVKVGVCDAYWTPAGATSEIFLGLTKGGCEFSYVPNWYDIQVDRYGQSQADAALVGESVSAKLPLAETDMKKIGMFAHTGVKLGGTTADGTPRKVAFGRFPGFRLGQCAGRLRLHPIAMGMSREEDITIYKAVNKAPLELGYKIDSERVYNCEFIGMVKRQRMDGGMLFEMGDSTLVDTLEFERDSSGQIILDGDGLPPSLYSLMLMSDGYIWASPSYAETSTTSTDINLRTTSLGAYGSFNGDVYNVSAKIQRVLSGYLAYCNGAPILSVAGDVNSVVESAVFATVVNGQVVMRAWPTFSGTDRYGIIDPNGSKTSAANYKVLEIADYITLEVGVEWNALKNKMNLKARLEP